MSTMAHPRTVVTGGVDTHRDVHAAAAVDPLGRVFGTATFEATATGYDRLRWWLESFGTLERVGVEGTGSWGAGLSRALTAVGISVIEVIRPNRQHRRRHGKSDVTDAVAAARAVLSGQAHAAPRGGTGPVESLRLLRIARNSARNQRASVRNQIHSVVATAPEQLRCSLRELSIPRIVKVAAGYRPTDPTDPYGAAKLALRALARRWRSLDEEVDQLSAHIETVVDHIAPAGLLDEVGVGPIVASDLLITAGDNPGRLANEASFAALCGSSPVDASSGLQQRHRLNRGGDRQANSALYRAVVVRLRYHQPTRDYMSRRLAQGKTKKEVIRCLKRFLARRVYHLLTQAQPAT